MAKIDFPSTPSNGDTFFANGIYYVYDSSKDVWKVFETGSNFTLNDAQTLEGQPGAYYLNYNNFTNVPPLITDTGNVTETTNLYYTVERANTAIDDRVTKNFITNLNIDTGNVVETTNLYFNTARANTAIDNRVTTSYIENLGIVSNTQLDTTLLNYATLIYVDEVAEGLRTKPAVELATVVHLEATYNNGNAGIGATLTANINGAFPTIDNVTITSTTLGTNGVLVKNQNNKAQNGRYNLTTVGNVSAAWVLTRCALCDEADEIPGAFTFVKAGNVNGGTGWVQVVSDPATFTVGTDDINVFQFSATAGTFVGNVGISVNGDEINNTGVLSVNGANGIITLSTTSLGAFGASNARIFTSGTTYIPTPNMIGCLVIATGGGGGGGGSDTDGAAGGAGGGGGSGSTAIRTYTAAQLGANATYAIGAAGLGGSGVNGTSGGTGGTTSFTPIGGGTALSAVGGNGGVGSGLAAVDSATAGGAGGTATGGIFNISGGGGGGGLAQDVLLVGISGLGGASFWGGGGRSVSSTGATSTAGVAGVARGSGGGGAVTRDTTAGSNGGDGAGGAVFVLEFLP